MKHRSNRLTNRILLFLAGNVLPLLIRIVGATWRLHIYNECNYLPDSAIFSIWHGHIIAHAYAFRNSGIKILISRSRDGEIIARATNKLGFGTIRGSSSRGGAKALLAIIDDVKSGSRVAITPDGPKGPGYIVKEGIAVAARKSEIPVVPAFVRAKPAIRLKSWDSFLIPLPFSRVDITIGEPLRFKSSDTLEHALHAIQCAMEELK